MKMSLEEAMRINRLADGRCPLHVRHNPACSICERIASRPGEPRTSPSREGGAAPEGVAARRAGKRIRQSAKPKLNKTEQEFERELQRRHDGGVFAQVVTFKLANGVRYTPDFIGLDRWCPSGLVLFSITAYEVKGFMRDDAAVKLKVAASAFPQIRWVLAWKESGQWREQTILS